MDNVSFNFGTEVGESHQYRGRFQALRRRSALVIHTLQSCRPFFTKLNAGFATKMTPNSPKVTPKRDRLLLTPRASVDV